MVRLCALGCALVLMLASGCRQGRDSYPPPQARGSAMPTPGVDAAPPGDIISVLLRDERLSRLATVMKGSGLTDLLATGGPYTVFAPDDVAFAELEPGLTELARSGNLGWLSDRLEYHVVRGSVSPPELRRTRTLTSVTGRTLRVSVEGTRTVLDGSAHVLASHESSSGWVYRIDEVLEPPASE